MAKKKKIKKKSKSKARSVKRKAKPMKKKARPKKMKAKVKKAAPAKKVKHVELKGPIEPMMPRTGPAAPVIIAPRGAPMPPVQVDRVHLQNIGYEISSMKRILERMLSQLEKLEAELADRHEE